ncbi:MAG: AarF/UbiB family protein, partial [Verrucomicrobiota bacterium]
LGLSDMDVEPYFQEVKKRLLEETDYSLELERSIALSEATSGKVKGLRFPKYYPEFSNRRVLTMDWIDGRPLDRFAREESDQSVKNEVAQAIWDFYQFQIHELKQFHADPHPGNFLIDGANEVVVLDFGCTKSLDPDFHRDYFRFLDLEVLNDPELFEAGLRQLEVLSDEDSPRERELILEGAERGARLLGRPFHEGEFDFSDESYMASIFEMGEEQRQNSELKRMKTARGSADSIYLNRAYFGLYSLMGLLKAMVKTR